MISFITLLSVVVLTITITLVSLKWLHNYRDGKITRETLLRNVFLEIVGILLAMVLAGLLGRYIAQIATEQITNNLIKFIAGILLGLLAGMGVGLLMKRAWGQLLKV